MQDAELKRYAELGPAYFWFAGKRCLAWALLTPYVGATDPRAFRILDVGCGPGHAFRELAHWGQTIGLDLSFVALTQCRGRNGSPSALIHASAERLPFPHETFSLVVAFNVFEHLEDDLAGLRECHRVAARNGWLVFTVPAFQGLWSEHDARYGHKRRFRVGELREKLDRAGFEVVRLSYCEALFLAPLWLLRQVKRQITSVARRDDYLKPPAWLNRWLTWLIASEALFLRRWDLPWGASIVGLVRKP